MYLTLKHTCNGNRYDAARSFESLVLSEKQGSRSVWIIFEMKLNLQLWTFLLVVSQYRTTLQTSVVTADADVQNCLTNTGDDGLCVYQYQCLDGRIITDGETLIDLRRAEDDCGEYLMVCCKDGNSSDEVEFTADDEVKNVPTTGVENGAATHPPSGAKGGKATVGPTVASTMGSSLHEGEENDIEETTDQYDHTIVDPNDSGVSQDSSNEKSLVKTTTEGLKNEETKTSGKGGNATVTPSSSTTGSEEQDRMTHKLKDNVTRGKNENVTVRPTVASSKESSRHEDQNRTRDKLKDHVTSGTSGNAAVTSPTTIITSTTKRPIQPPPLNIPEFNVEGCGHRNPNGVVFSLQNNVHSESEYGEYPWVAAIFVRDDTKTELQYRCGGALIDQAAVLTSASCLHLYRSKPSQVVVRLGEWDMSTKREPIPHVDSEAETVHIHPEYSTSSKINDIAIVILRETMVLNHTIGVVCLPHPPEVPNGGDLIGAGWGDAPLFVTPKKFPQSILKKAHLKRISNGECQKKMDKLMNRKFKLHRSFICAEAIDTEMLPCRGDSGSPYVVEVSGGSERYYLVGLSSWGYDCNRQNTPTVMTDVAYHRDWIDKVIKQENLNPWTYTYHPEENNESEENK